MKKLIVVLLMSAFVSVSFSGSFEKKAFRYPSPHEMIDLLRTKFMRNDSYGNCYLVNDQNKDSLGVNQPGTGEPLNREPNSFFAIWLSGCVVDYISTGFIGASSTSPLHTELWGEDFKAANGNTSPLYYRPLGEVGKTLRQTMISRALLYFVGPPSVVNKYMKLSGRAGENGNAILIAEIESKVEALMASTDAEVSEVKKKFNFRTNPVLQDYLSMILLVICQDDAFVRI